MCDPGRETAPKGENASINPKKLERLEKLDLDGCCIDDATMVEGIRALPALRYLSLRQVPSVPDLAQLVAQCPSLRFLYLDNNPIPQHALHPLRALNPKLFVHLAT